jgi:hypothetical protein
MKVSFGRSGLYYNIIINEKERHLLKKGGFIEGKLCSSLEEEVCNFWLAGRGGDNLRVQTGNRVMVLIDRDNFSLKQPGNYFFLYDSRVGDYHVSIELKN